MTSAVYHIKGATSVHSDDPNTHTDPMMNQTILNN
eukprot:CAMPEP_0168314688 /NCGR_PEP_ID=MMETSP0210-20121227/9306_1 /TAXON_ID=40633 /ORGANISM="Condylostoma magnum, Strain COL2" /LENGTH=34 /DNA_ID= /DNA_START= /DNA_END= /DNA_ORIENTATION=